LQNEHVVVKRIRVTPCVLATCEPYVIGRQMSGWYEVTVDVPVELSDMTASYLLDLGSPGLQSIDGDGVISLIAYFREPSSIAALDRLLSQLRTESGRPWSPVIRSREIDEQDWADQPFREDRSRGLCYFDDHVDQAARLEQAAAKGFPLAIFDDDFPVTSFAEMAHDGAALPKIEFVLDEALRNQSEISWISRGRRRTWPVDHAALDRARKLIAASERLPNTSLVTGIHQTPYRIVRLDNAAGRALART